MFNISDMLDFSDEGPFKVGDKVRVLPSLYRGVMSRNRLDNAYGHMNLDKIVTVAEVTCQDGQWLLRFEAAGPPYLYPADEFDRIEQGV